LLKGSLNNAGSSVFLFLEHPVNQPIKPIAKLFRKPVGQHHQDPLQAFILQELIQDGIAGPQTPFHLLRKQRPDKQRAGMLLEIREIIVYLLFKLPGLPPERSDLQIESGKTTGGIG
jgi:hypothetical protein